MSASLLQSVSMSELIHMRDVEHMSNRDIADRVGVNYMTILRHLGENPNKSKRKRREEKLPAISETPVQSFTQRLAEMAVETPSVEQPIAEEVQYSQPEPQETVEDWTEGFKVVSYKLKAESATARYYIDRMEGTVDVVPKRSAQDAVQYTKETLDGYIAELMEVLSLMGG